MVDPLEARKALKVVTDTVTDLEKQVADIVIREKEVTAQNRSLLIMANDAQQKLAAAQSCCNEKTDKVNELAPQVRDLTRRLNEETARADTHEAVRGVLQDKADAHDKVVGLALKLLDAFDRLPMKPEEGHPIPSDVQQDIALYGTYEWKTLADAKLALERMTSQ
jgi:polyhydroxyalkanoate synthesis regulator phasin